MKRVFLILILCLSVSLVSLTGKTKADDFCYSGWELYGDLLVTDYGGGIRQYDAEYWCSATGQWQECTWICWGSQCGTPDCTQQGVR